MISTEEREWLTHSVLARQLITPIPSFYEERDSGLVASEEAVFAEELRIKAAVHGKKILSFVSLQLLPASMAVMETFSKEYAQARTSGEKRRERMSKVYKLGAVIGLGASSLADTTDQYPEEFHPEIVTSIAKNGLISCDQPSKEITERIDPKVHRMVEEVAMYINSDGSEESDSLSAATSTGYYVGRSLAELTIK